MPTCLLVLRAERVAIPDQSLVSTLSQQHSIGKGNRSVHHDLLPCHGLQTLHKHVQCKLIPKSLLTQFKLQLLELRDKLLDRASLVQFQELVPQF